MEDLREFSDRLTLSRCRPESEVVENWSFSEQAPIVSILCACYNQAEYIENTLSGFLHQETDFPFEVIVHDDASTDSSATIIKKFEEHFPNIVRPIYQTQNQMSQGKSVAMHMRRHAKGKYLALCEGDDFWFAKDKLKLQAKCLDENSNVSLCFHQSTTWNLQSDSLLESVPLALDHSCVISTEAVFADRGHFISTETMFFRNQDWAAYGAAVAGGPSGDLFLKLYMSLRGDVHYLHFNGSMYRYLRKASWSENIQNNGQGIYSSEMIQPLDRLYQLCSGAKKSGLLYNTLAGYLRSSTTNQPLSIRIKGAYSRLKRLQNFNRLRASYALLKYIILRRLQKR